MSWVIKAEGGGAGMVADAAEVRRALILFADPQSGVELMSLRAGIHATRPGTDIDGLCADVAGFPGPQGVYFRVNPVPSALDRPARNDDVLNRRWIYIDVDPVKPAEHKDDPATEEEKARTATVCAAVHEHLAGFGWPDPVVTDSGNGLGVFYRCDLPNSEHVRTLYRKLVAGLAAKFSNDDGVIDKSIHNANRLAKLPGTWARKGTSSPDRPHRPCRLISVPAAIRAVTPEQFQAAASGEHKPEFTARATNGGGADAYGRKALDAECTRVALASPGTRNDALNRAAFSLGQLVGGGVLSREEVVNRLFAAACRAGLDEDPGCGESGIRATIKSGLEAGLDQPRTAPPPKPEVNGQAKKKEAPAGRVIYWASEVTPRPVEWLWPGRIPLGKLTTFAGTGGLGKTMALCDISSRITRGLDWPDSAGECAVEGKVLFISGEDDPEDTLVPRLIEHEADLSRVAFLTTAAMDAFTLADVPLLERALAEMGADARLVVIDPPTAYLGGVDDHKNAELRGLLTPLMHLAKKHRVAIVFNTHVNKPSGQKVEAAMRVMGSVAWVNAMRSAHIFAKDPEDKTIRYFCGMKNNLGGERLAMKYRIVETGLCARIEWLGECDINADDAANNQKPTRKRSILAAEWLEELFDSEVKLPSKTVFDRAKEETTLSRNALLEAKDVIGIKAKQEADGEGERCWFWFWSLEAREAYRARKSQNTGQNTEKK